MGAYCCDSSQDTNLRPGVDTSLARKEADTMMNQPIKIEYFGGSFGRVDPIRQMLVHKSVDFKFIGYTPDSWASLKESGNSGEMGGLPIVHYGGGQGRQQTMAILRSLGAMHGYYNPSDWKTCAFVDMVAESYNDVFNAAAKAMLFTPDEEKPAAFEALRDGLVKKFMRICETRFEQNAAQMFIASDEMTIADFCLASFVFNTLKNELSPIQPVLSPMLLKFPLFTAYTKRLEKEVSAHIERRPKAPL
uniref:GST C-terminal domain-containing protein n=1 Tax=Favella ehrenbergii TaxID=182087 RepID=A0A7S3HWL3_9SPIT|mmetsp:Transcript_15114/g.19112  ORF Transcript_15114/g.19112 Transcript_15114/m.19112 type:complete len:248 (+) Transcript_15114:32-775(+)|eukprot:CAMPEP_0170468852 /NCGR_PEP_ID=MMETSP0123-20130129/11882_1 /TAXON_ID=182087 /ORGANISM="Favella ehrenbergii, Strain Fehren 1" /LENGTH=247 /DNA_ID=CAMNT_0010735535 /DNA_START=23 /DNA_END=766 /DNA_ORIENTATION=-